MRTWDYRVVKKYAERFDEYFYEIHEIYFNENNEITGITEQPSYPIGDSLEELKERLEHYSSALEKPVIDFESLKFEDFL